MPFRRNAFCIYYSIIANLKRLINKTNSYEVYEIFDDGSFAVCRYGVECIRNICTDRQCVDLCCRRKIKKKRTEGEAG